MADDDQDSKAPVEHQLVLDDPYLCRECLTRITCRCELCRRLHMRRCDAAALSERL